MGEMMLASGLGGDGASYPDAEHGEQEEATRGEEKIRRGEKTTASKEGRQPREGRRAGSSRVS